MDPGLSDVDMSEHLFSPALRLHTSQHGTGIVAQQPVARGDILLRVPASLCVTSRRAHRTPELAHLLSGRGVEAHTAIAIWLMRAVDVRPAMHAAWLDALPRSLDCTLGWSAQELSWLQRSPARQKAEAMQHWAETEWQRIFAPAPAVSFNSSLGHFKCAAAPPPCRSLPAVLRCLRPIVAMSKLNRLSRA